MGQFDRSQDRSRFLRRRVSPLSQKGQSRRDKQTAHPPKWDDLPDSLLEMILNKLESMTQGWTRLRALFAASSVCRSWRQITAPRLYRGLWEGPFPMTLSHPAQLFAMSPRRDSPLVKCYIMRESTAGKCGSASVVYRLFLGNDPSSSHSKFLLSATQHPWQHTSMYLNYHGTGLPCAKMLSNVLGTSHKLTRCESSFFPHAILHPEMGTELPRSETLAAVKYKLRMKGMMRPRRLHVSLPEPMNKTPSPDGTSEPKGLIERIRHRHHTLQSIAYSGRESCETPLNRRCASSNMKLINKPPHWNEGLKCWCLNFRGRVKLASVKNFQLICDSDGAGKIVMQFGKVDADVFIMDFNPTVISTVQAFSIALTSFEGKVLL